MSPDAERPVELEAEHEVDFGRYVRRVAARWWLLVIGAALGALVGFLVSLSGGNIYKATAQVYLGQPLAPDSAAPVSTAPTTLGLVLAYVTSEEAIQDAAELAGLKPARLRERVTARPIPGASNTKQATPAPLASITVTGSSRTKTAAAANALARQAVGRVGAYTKTKIDTLNEQLDYINRQIEIVNRRLEGFRAQQEELVGNTALTPAERLVALTSLNSEIELAESRLATLEINRFNTRRAISLANDIEASKVTASAVATKTEPTSKRTSVVVGAFIGFLLGIVAALVWDRLIARFGAGAEPSAA